MWLERFAAWGSAIGLAACFLATGAAQAAPVARDAVKIPALTLMDGQERPAGYYDGKPVIIEYWASWCPFCARQNPYLQRLWDDAKNKGLEVLAISIDRDEADARKYIQEKKYTFPVVMQTPELLQTFGKRRIIPKIIVVKADGKVAEVIPGEMFEEDVLELIKYAPEATQ